jgi:hypothetical protein
MIKSFLVIEATLKAVLGYKKVQVEDLKRKVAKKAHAKK